MIILKSASPMHQNSSWETDSRSASQGISRLNYKSEVH